MKIEKTYYLPYPQEQVYKAWVCSDTVIEPATAMDIKPVVGGHYRLIMEQPGFSSRNEGEFLEVRPEEFIRYTWEWNGDGEVTEIAVTFSATESGTQISLIHSHFQKQQSADQHDSGWDSYMAGFQKHLANQ